MDGRVPVPEREQRLGVGNVDDRGEPAERAEDLAGSRDRIATDRVEDEIHATVSLGANHLCVVLARVVDQPVDTDRPHEACATRAARREDASARGAGDLDGEGADTARGSVDQHGLPRTKLAPHDEAFPGGPARARNARCLLVRDPRGLPRDDRRVDDRVLRVAAVPVEGPRLGVDLVTFGEVADVLPRCLHDAREIRADHRWKRQLVPVVAPARLVVDRVHGSCPDPHEQLVGPRNGNGNLGRLEDIRAAEGCEQDSLHCQTIRFSPPPKEE